MRRVRLCLTTPNEELTEIRREAGAVIESGVMTPISEDYFTNYPDAFIKH
ncbi:hypothetical protein OAH74_04120 [Amylibacter sp.]|nr:hypothetical protein [Amylibacter sp.]